MSSLIIQETAQHTSEWLKAVNPIVPINVQVVETDTGFIKIGDGVTPYNILAYSGSVINDRQLINAIFTDAPAGDISFMISPNETVEFEFSVGKPNSEDTTLSSNNMGTSRPVVLCVGENRAAPIDNNWAIKSHSLKTHTTSSVNNTVALLSFSHPSCDGFGKIIRRKLLGTSSPFAIHMEYTDYTEYLVQRLCTPTAGALPVMIPNDDPIKIQIGIHPDVRGFFKARRV